MPTSWWEAEINESYELIFIASDTGIPNDPDANRTGWVRRLPESPSVWERVRSWWSDVPTASRDPWEYSPLLAGDMAALPVLLALLQSDNPEVVWVAINGLEELPDRSPNVLAALEAATRHADETVRSVAEEALARLKRQRK